MILINRVSARKTGEMGLVRRVSSSPLFTRSENSQKFRLKKIVNRESLAKKIPKKKYT
jgi:hypothetical protein